MIVKSKAFQHQGLAKCLLTLVLFCLQAYFLFIIAIDFQFQIMSQCKTGTILELVLLSASGNLQKLVYFAGFLEFSLFTLQTGETRDFSESYMITIQYGYVSKSLYPKFLLNYCHRSFINTGWTAPDLL